MLFHFLMAIHSFNTLHSPVTTLRPYWMTHVKVTAEDKKWSSIWQQNLAELIETYMFHLRPREYLFSPLTCVIPQCRHCSALSSSVMSKAIPNTSPSTGKIGQEHSIVIWFSCHSKCHSLCINLNEDWTKPKLLTTKQVYFSIFSFSLKIFLLKNRK